MALECVTDAVSKKAGTPGARKKMFVRLLEKSNKRLVVLNLLVKISCTWMQKREAAEGRKNFLKQF